MSAPKAGLDANDLKILETYALDGNRELYFNYLAQKQGNDGYGLLALGVVRNDNAPGATANTFADRQARADNVHFNEKEWQVFGVDLMQRDIERRQYWLEQQKPELALNLPVRDVQKAHDDAFRVRHIHPSAWTPYKLLEAARRYGSEPEAEAVWTMLLDNSRRGLDRSTETVELVLYKYHGLIDDPDGYLLDMAEARKQHGLRPVANTDPYSILYNGRMHHHREGDGWVEELTRRTALPFGAVPVPGPGITVGTRAVTDPITLKELDEARDVRLQRETLRQQFHPDDPNRDRPILRSPWLIGDGQPAQPAPQEAGRLHAAADFTAPHHPRHALWQQCCEGVRALDAAAGKPWDAHSACMAGSLTALAAASGLDRVDHVLLSQRGAECAHGEYVFVVQGRLDDPAHLRAHMPTVAAITQSAERSFQQVQAGDRLQAEQLAQQQAQDEQLQQGRSGPAMRG